MPKTIRLLLLALLAAGCRAERPHIAHDGRFDDGLYFEDAFRWERYRFGAEVFYEDYELDEIEFEDDLETIFGDGLRDVERRRAGVRVSYGVQEIRGFVQLFGEEIDDFDERELNPGTSLTIDDLFGVGVGVAGEPTLEHLNDDSRLILGYRANASLVAGDGTFRDTNTSTLLASSEEDGDVAYFNQELQAGIGVDVHGFRPMVGVYADFLGGAVDDDIVRSNRDDDLTFDGFNAGLYAELGYRSPRFPFQAGVRAIGGDVTGFTVFVGTNL